MSATDEVELFGFVYTHNTACILCTHVAAGEPVALVVHDSDGDISFACARSAHDDAEFKVIALGRAASIVDFSQLPHLDEGQQAERTPDGEWRIGTAA
ncbi:hypothetical protein [Sphingomonas sp.]|uniref:hypothetical protein n=1 Tax=Sphingomonas sp. TaxID=28214 RepID=UPI00286EB351|nr:hypothetical protein [Sphingomonas sp.]